MKEKDMAKAKRTSIVDTSEVDAFLEADASHAAPPSVDALNALVEQAELLRDLERRAAAKVDEAQELTKQARKLREEVLPQLMDSLELRDFTLTDGTKVERGEEVFASISKENADAACSWLEEHGASAIVKTQITVLIDKGDMKLATKARKLLEKAKIPYLESRTVHPATLKSYVKEVLQAAKVTLPASIGVHVQPVASMKAPRAPKRTGTTMIA
jgi:hypothetical protein